MGRRGSAPTPTSLLNARGSRRATKRRDEMEAKGPEGTPECPDWLYGAGRARCAEPVPQLERMGVLTVASTSTPASSRIVEYKRGRPTPVSALYQAHPESEQGAVLSRRRPTFLGA